MKKIFAVAIILILIIVSLISCEKGDNNSASITIGAVLPLTGSLASYGKNAKSGIDMAVDEINSSGNLKINVLYEDDAGKATAAVDSVQKLISTNKVPLIIGEASSSLSLAVAPICNSNKVVLFSPISSAAELTEKGGEYFFRVCPSDAFQARVTSKWLLEQGIKRVSILFTKSSWGQSLKDVFTENYTKDGGTVVGVEECNQDERDFRTRIAKLSKSSPQAIVGFTYGKEGGAFIRQVREMGIKLPLYGGDPWGTPELIEAAGSAAEGAFFTFPSSPSGEKYATFADKYKKQFGKEPDIYSAYSYDLMNIVANALKGGARTGEQIRQYLGNMPEYVGVTGPSKFDEHGDVISKTFDRKVIRGGKYMVVK